MEETNWVILTGGPSSGKTSLCMRLAAEGYSIFPEAARLVIDSEISEGKTIEQIRGHEGNFQIQVLEWKAKMECCLAPDKLVFFDRGIPDSLGYGVDLETVEQYVKFRYRKVFFLQSVGLVKDYARTENDKQSKEIATHILEAYQKFGYEPILVPKMSLNKRMEFILKALQY